MSETKKVRVCFKNNCFTAIKAETIWQKMRGLMGVESLARDEGMLFIFPREAVRSFWMKGVHIPLDIIWLSEKFEVVEITKNQQPCKKLFCPAITPAARSKYVLEVNAGEADKLGLKVGDQAKTEEPRH